MTSVTMKKASQYAASLSPVWSPGPSERPQPRSTGARSSAKAEAPKAADRNPARVTPTWAAARNRFGSACRAATFSPRRPRWASALTWPSRSDTSAVSDPEKKPPSTRKKPTSRALASVPFTACHTSQGGRVGTPVWSSRPSTQRRRTGHGPDPAQQLSGAGEVQDHCLLGAEHRHRQADPPQEVAGQHRANSTWLRPPAGSLVLLGPRLSAGVDQLDPVVGGGVQPGQSGRTGRLRCSAGQAHVRHQRLAAVG